MNSNPLINILVRISRPDLWPRCLASIKACSYQNIRIIAYVSTPLSIDTEDCDIVVQGEADRSVKFFYNLFLNDLLAYVMEGYFFMLDDDDILMPDALNVIALELSPDKPIICQMLRNGKPKPMGVYMDKRWVVRGHIGMPCMILHSKWKNAYTFEAVEDADFRWISTINKLLPCKFVQQVLVDVGERKKGGNS